MNTFTVTINIRYLSTKIIQDWLLIREAFILLQEEVIQVILQHLDLRALCTLASVSQ